jgi:hypothetical protein
MRLRRAARYAPEQTVAERVDIENGIWLCAVCSDRIDKDPDRYPAETLRRWKLEHERWVDGQSWVPDLPRFELIEQQGLTVPLNVGVTITSAHTNRYRERTLVVHNQNRVPLFDMAFEIQLPEPIVYVFRPIKPPSCNLSFEPNHPKAVASASGGGSVSINRPLRPTPNWRCAIDRLAASSTVQIPFWTEPDWLNDAIGFADSGFEAVEAIEYFLDGVFTFELRGEFLPRTVFVALQFDPNSRSIVTLKPQPDSGTHQVVRSQRLG